VNRFRSSERNLNSSRRGAQVIANIIAIAAVLAAASAAAAPVRRACPAGVPVATFTLMVHPEVAAHALPMQAINVIRAGDSIRYEPFGDRFDGNKKARIAVILVPEDAAASVRVLPARPARTPAEWRLPMRVAAVGLVLGPAGIDESKLSGLLEHDPGVVDRLADYAEQHTKVEALIQALSSYEQSAPGTGSLQGALKGFSAQYGVDLPTLDRTRPADEQASALLRAITPAFASNSPSSTLAQQSGGLAASVASMFFGAPVGIAVGGAALAGNLHSSLFPPADFQSAFTQPDDANHLILCTDTQKRSAKARLEFVWVTRVPDAEPPSASVEGAPRIPAGWRSTITVRCTTVGQLKALPRAREWRLTAGGVSVAVPVRVESGSESDTLTLDLTQANVPPGQYSLEAMWDWTHMRVAGSVTVRPFADLSKAVISQTSQDQLVAGGGSVTIDLVGADFEFVSRASLARADQPTASIELPIHTHGGPDVSSSPVQVTVDTHALQPGSHLLTLTQLNGVSQTLPAAVHPPLPMIVGLPLHMNVGDARQTIHLRGTSLERIDRISSANATWTLTPIPAGAHDVTDRDVEVQLGSGAKAGERLSLSLSVAGLYAPVAIESGAVVLDPRPKIDRVDISFAGQPVVELRAREIPAGVPAGFAISADGLGLRPTVQVRCADDSSPNLNLTAGERHNSASLARTGQRTLFLSADPGTIASSGCLLNLVITNGSTGASDPYVLGRAVRLPRIESFTLSADALDGNLYAGTLRGESLELIERAGWTPDSGWPVRGTATPVAGSAGSQTLQIALPWPSPSPHAPLFIWLRDEHDARKTNARY
jgi:hypothetical protein